MSPETAARNTPFGVLSPEKYERVRIAQKLDPATEAFYRPPDAKFPDGVVVMKEDAAPDQTYHEYLHSKADSRFRDYASAKSTGFEEAATQMLARRAMEGGPVAPTPSAYDGNVARIEALKLPPGVLEQAYFGGDTAGLSAAIQSRTGKSASDYFATFH